MPKIARTSKSPALKPHPYCELLPIMSEAEYKSLRDDIAANKQQDSIELFEGKILDGRNRYRACLELKIAPKLKKFSGTAADAIALVKSRMMHRNLDAPRKACVAIQFADAFQAEAKKRMLAGKATDPSTKLYEGDTKPQRAMDLLGSAFAVSPTYLFQVKRLRDASPALFRQVFEGTKQLPVAVREVQRRAKSKAIATQTAAVVADAAGAPFYNLAVGNCIEVMKSQSPWNAKLIFADPPYNLGLDYGRGAKADSLKPEKYAAICDDWIGQCVRHLAEDGSLFIMNSVNNLKLMLDLTSKRKLHLRNVICWVETFGNYTPHNFTQCWRPILYFTMSPKRFTWHGDQILIPSDRQTKYGDKRAVAGGKVPGNVWMEFPRLVDNAKERMPGFPTQLPVGLLERIIKVASNPGDRVADPFTGSGTTGAAAIRHNRKFVGVDLEEKNIAFARARLAAVAAEVRKSTARKGA